MLRPERFCLLARLVEVYRLDIIHDIPLGVAIGGTAVRTLQPILANLNKFYEYVFIDRLN